MNQFTKVICLLLIFTNCSRKPQSHRTIEDSNQNNKFEEVITKEKASYVEVLNQLITYKSMYEKMYTTADSLKKTNKIGFLESFVFEIADSLDNGHPSAYFIKSGELLAKAKYNEASFLYYLGYLRYRFYNLTNPTYKISDDGALYTSFKSIIGEPINIYLKANIDNFISIINSSVKYHNDKDYRFYPRSKNVDNYDKQSNDLINLNSDLEKNKTKYVTGWNEERKTMERNIDNAIEKYNKKIKHNKKSKN
ncbi:MAG: hypothetical protein JNL70_23695 [Saprospiraceae bacterium]|nr:hypothetical protein [Saprospiraceae bacterium]